MPEATVGPSSEDLQARVGVLTRGRPPRDGRPEIFPLRPAVPGPDLPRMAEEAVRPRGEHLEMGVDVLRQDRLTRDDRPEILPVRPAAVPVPVQLPPVTEASSRPRREHLQASVTVLGHGRAARDDGPKVLQADQPSRPSGWCCHACPSRPSGPIANASWRPSAFENTAGAPLITGPSGCQFHQPLSALGSACQRWPRRPSSPTARTSRRPSAFCMTAGAPATTEPRSTQLDQFPSGETRDMSPREPLGARPITTSRPYRTRPITSTLPLRSRRLRCAPVAKIAVVHVPYFSHIDAAMRLGRVLIRQGHQLVVWAPEAWREEIESCGALFELHDPEMPGPRTNTFKSFVAELARMTEERTAEMIEQLFTHEVDLVVHDSQVPWARIAGDYLGLPRIVSHPMFPIISPHHIRSEGDQSDRELDDPEQATELFETHWLSIARRWGVDLGGWDNVIHSTSSSETTVAYTTEEILGPHWLEPTWHCVGPLMEPLPPRVEERERPLVYVCLGTSFNTRKSVFEAAIEGLASEPVDVLVSTGDGIISPDDLAPLPSNVTVRDYVSTREALTRGAPTSPTAGATRCTNRCSRRFRWSWCPRHSTSSRSPAESRGSARVSSSKRRRLRFARQCGGSSTTRRCRPVREIARHLISYDGERRVAEIVSRVLEEDVAPSTAGAGG